ncbi:DEAD/DEAH box helicase [Pendulispora albinea]|uniref:DEAD/DEAH box helicase n=1 Tax=Pendulispora albinea TaxID=2741071 RepID=A0ABZ2LJ44_9BACT
MSEEASPPSSSTPPTFDVIPLSADVRRAIDALGYVHPTPVQRAVFEPAVRGRSLVVQARTGTGKTAAFGLPIVDQLVRRGVNQVQALILTPTRELALQVARELTHLGQFRGTKVTAIYGGAPMGKQIDELASGAQVVAGTPGRVLDHLRRGTLDPSNIRIFVLDEADEMLSMGFAKELHAIVDLLPRERQGLFFSATIPPDIERLAVNQLRDPEFVTLSSDQVGALEIHHFVYLVGQNDKRKELIRILDVEDPESAIVFCNTRDETERVAEVLKNHGYDAEWLNGDLEQRERERIMQNTREGKLRFLVATDVAARGIDISHLTHVINADFPESAEQYVHRTGRTGRAGKTGTAISLVGPKNIGALYILRLTYKIRPIEKQLPTAAELKTRTEHDLLTMFAEAFGKAHVQPDDLALARRLLTHIDVEPIVAGLLRGYLGAREEAGEDPKQEAAEARRAKNPPKLESEPAAPPAPVMARADGRRGDREPPPPSVGPRRPSRSGGARAELRRHGTSPIARESGYREPRYQVHDAPVAPAPVDPAPPVATVTVPAPAPVPTPAPQAPQAPHVVAAAEGNASDASEAEAQNDERNFARIFVNVGRRDGVGPLDFHRMLFEGAGLSQKDVGPIHVRDRISFVSVRREWLDKSVSALAGQIVGGRSIVAEPARERA